MKKILAIILSLMMVLSLCACGSEPSSEPEHEEIGLEDPVTEEPSSEEEEEQPKEEPEVEAKRGKTENGVYYNDAFGITFNGGDEWYFYNDEEIAATYGIAAEQMFTEEYAQIVEDASLVYDMYALNANSGDTVNINYENLGIIYGSVFDEKAYLEISKTQLETQLSASGIGLMKNEVSTVKVGEKEVPCLEVIIDYGGVYIYEILIPKKTGSWMGVVTVASVEEANLSGIVEKISFE